MTVQRSDAGRLIELVNARTSAGMELLGLAEQGESGGAAYVCWPDGRPGVLTTAPGPSDELERTARVLELARSRGIPAPRYHLVTCVDGATVVVQERLSGTPPTHIDRSTIEAVAEMTERFAGVLADHSEVANPTLHLRTSGGELYQHNSLATYDQRTRRLLQRIHAIGAAGGEQMAGDDLVHLDFTPGNILFDDAGVITGVVDWHGVNGLARGDRRFGLVTLRFDLAWGAALDPGYPPVDEAATEYLDTLIDAIPAPLLRRYWAHMSLRMVDWTIRHHRPADVDHQLAFAATRLS